MKICPFYLPISWIPEIYPLAKFNHIQTKVHSSNTGKKKKRNANKVIFSHIDKIFHKGHLNLRTCSFSPEWSKKMCEFTAWSLAKYLEHLIRAFFITEILLICSKDLDLLCSSPGEKSWIWHLTTLKGSLYNGNFV